VLEQGGGQSGEDQVISKQVRQKVSCCSLLVENLEEETSYSFSVRAKNTVLSEVGPAVWQNVSTGPQFGSPKSPKDLDLLKMYASVLFKWTNDEKSKITGYYIEAKRKGGFGFILVFFDTMSTPRLFTPISIFNG
jgi:protein sidekick